MPPAKNATTQVYQAAKFCRMKPFSPVRIAPDWIGQKMAQTTMTEMMILAGTVTAIENPL